MYFQRAIEREREDNKFRGDEQRNSQPGAGNFYYYWSYSQINNYLTQLTKFYGDRCQTETVGFSYEGRAIRAMKIGRFDGTRPIVFFEAGVHAREWIAPMTALYLMEQLVINYDIHYELQRIDIIIIPVLNPDGYEYSQQYVRNF